MSDYMDRLEARIRRLKQDAYANNDWRRARIEIEKHGGRWRADNGTVYELHDGVIYQYMSDYKEGVSNLIISAIDAPIPYIATLDMDLQGTPPEKRKALLEELERTAARLQDQKEYVVIVENDWLSKITQRRWGTTDWSHHLRPTKMTLESRKLRGKPFNPDLIYPGDMFEVIA